MVDVRDPDLHQGRPGPAVKEQQLVRRGRGAAGHGVAVERDRRHGAVGDEEAFVRATSAEPAS